MTMMLKTIVPQLTQEQLQAAKLVISEKRGIAWWKVGEGKTRIAIAWMLMLADNPSSLVICSPQAYRQWQDEIDLVGLGDEIKLTFLSSGMLSTKRGVETVNKIITHHRFDCIVIDELWMYKNVRSERSKLICQLSKQFPTIGLSGSMMTARKIEDLYGQIKAVGLGEKVARGLTDFRQQYTIEVQNFKGYLERYPKRHALEQIQEKLKDNVHIYFPKEIREIRNIPINVEPSTEQTTIRKQLVKEYYLDNINGQQINIDIKNAATLVSKLQQVSDGFIYDSKGTSISIESNKLARLIQLVSEFIDAGERVVVWTAFKQTIQEILALSKFKSVVMSGDVRFDFETWNKKKADVCFATVGSGSSINDFKDVKYSIIYSSPYSYRAIQQVRGRTNRKDSSHPCCYYYYLQTLDFPDSDVYLMLDESKTAEDLLIKRMQKLVNEYMKENESTKKQCV